MIKSVPDIFIGIIFYCMITSIGLSDVKIFEYKKVGGKAKEIEVHFPKNHDKAKQVPAIIMFHGGAWKKGDRSQFRFLCEYFATRGLVAATVTYTLGKGKQACITDAKSAIRWYKQNASDLGIDPKRIITGGGSAGGHISLLATTNPGLNDPNDPKDIDTSVVAYLLFNPALKPSKNKDVTFENFITENMPPMVAFWGTNDIWLKGWNAAVKKLESLKNDSINWWTAEGQKHAFFNKEPWKTLTVIQSDKFLVKQGLLKGKPTLKAPDGKALVKTK